MTTRYNRPAIALHWLMAVGLLATIALGLYMHDLPLSPSKLQLYSWHKWAGISLLMLALLRLFWRIICPAPPLPSSISGWSKFAAHAGHILLYGFMFAVPMSGWLMSSAQGFQVVWFGTVPLPDLVSRNSELAAVLKQVHMYLNYGFLIVISGHALVALLHHFVKKDTVLTRMLPFLAKA